MIGNVPEKSIFKNTLTSKYLNKYYKLTKYVALGKVLEFRKLLTEYNKYFKKDGYLMLIDKLSDIVIINGIKQISQSYSRIDFNSIKKKLGLDENEEVENIIAKCARDKIIFPIINHREQYVTIKPNIDYYSSNKPQLNLKKKIDFCISYIDSNNKNLVFKKQALKPKEEENINEEEDDMTVDDDF